MANPRITTTPEGLQLRVDAVGDARAELLDLLSSCADGACACASDEYQKVESMQVEPDELGITVSVRTKPGEAIDPSCVTECLGSVE